MLHFDQKADKRSCFEKFYRVVPANMQTVIGLYKLCNKNKIMSGKRQTVLYNIVEYLLWNQVLYDHPSCMATLPAQRLICLLYDLIHMESILYDDPLVSDHFHLPSGVVAQKKLHCIQENVFEWLLINISGVNLNKWDKKRINMAANIITYVKVT